MFSLKLLILLQLYALRKIMQGPESMPKAPLGNNSRPLQGVYHRTVRTNINFRKVNLLQFKNYNSTMIQTLL